MPPARTIHQHTPQVSRVFGRRRPSFGRTAVGSDKTKHERATNHTNDTAMT